MRSWTPAGVLYADAAASAPAPAPAAALGPRSTSSSQASSQEWYTSTGSVSTLRQRVPTSASIACQTSSTNAWIRVQSHWVLVTPSGCGTIGRAWVVQKGPKARLRER